MNDIMVKFIRKYKIEELSIYETDFWVWSLRPNQSTLGSGILSLKRECGIFSELKQEEYCDLNNIIKVIEGTLKQLFNYDIMNYLMLMMVDKQVHYHIIPRYEKKVELFGEIWVDYTWPGLPNLSGDVLDKEKLHKIFNYIKNNLKTW
ncbi:hypothetical protein ACFO4N_17285 [Camelliibacillus cellulosilyticus]|uniref:Diadenosine tetraphosphate (Ap4A) HIT family hydrolase n=1 Tax=Camelliibacillus cellulosilyticus TaxID=2174486 RepID=A0ABV9GUT4_9BACL